MRFSLSPMILGVVLFSSVLLAGCSQNRAVPAAESESPSPAAANSDTSVPTITSPLGEETLEIRNFEYAPSTLTVKPGQTIQVTNLDSVQHDVVSRDGVSFRTAILNEGETGSFVAPDQPGTYEYYCSLHPQMVATLVVEE